MRTVARVLNAAVPVTQSGARNRMMVTLLALSLVVGAAPAALAAKPAPPSIGIKVTTTSDTVANDGLCSLREAITAANTNTASGSATGECPAGGSSGSDTVTVPPGAGAYNVSGDLDILSDVNIVGAGPPNPVVDGGGITRAFYVADSGATVTLSGLTLSGGHETFGDGGGGILNLGTLTVTDSTLSGNSVGGTGGGILNLGTLTVTDSTLSGNSASAQFGGGGIRNRGTLTVTNSTLSGNSASSPSGIGGGILNDGTLTVTNSTLSGNSAGGEGSGSEMAAGGGISNFNGSTLTVTNSTLSANSTTGAGGGIANGGELTVTNSTLWANSAGLLGGGILNGASGDGRVTNSILASNIGGNCSGSFIDGGNNISYPAEPGCATFSSGDPKLGPLQDNGGPTKTMAPGLGSAAIDAGNNAVCGAPLPPGGTGAGGKDQRGAVRGADGDNSGFGGCDIGAHEFNDADLAVAVDAPGSVTGGSTMTYEIKVSNLGPMADPGVVLANTLPGGTKFLSYTVTQGSCTTPGRNSSGGVVRCTFGAIETGVSSGATITIKVAVNASSPIQNVARVSGGRFDPNGSNNVAVTNTVVTK